MSLPFNTNSFSLRFKILVCLFLVLGISMAMSLYGIWTFERGKLIGITRQETIRAGLTVKSGLRHAMLQNNTDAIRSTVTDMARVSLLTNISVLGNKGRVIFSSDPAPVGTIIDTANDQTCVVCHKKSDVPPTENIAIFEVKDGPTLRNIIKIENEPACHACHPADQKTLGILMVDSSLAAFYSVLRETATWLILTGFLTFMGIVVVISYIVSRFITNPLLALLDGFDRVGKGDFRHWLELNGSREFADIAVSFNVMSRAVGRYLGEVKEKAKEISTLYTIVKRMSKSIEWKQVKEVVISLLGEILNAESVVLVIPIEKKENHFAIYSKQNENRLFRTDYSLAFEHAPHAVVPRDDFLYWIEKKYSMPIFLDGDRRVLIPLLFKETQFGLIGVLKKQSEHFSAGKKKLIPALTQHVSIAFTNARLYDMAITDSLTGLYTKRYLKTKLQDMVNLYHRLPEEGFCLLLLDLDHFKDINDTYGHLVGDQVLVQLARLIRTNIRDKDIPCRYGGEEFVVLLPGETIQEATLVAERLRNKVEGYTFCASDGPPIQRTVSIGLAGCPSHGSSADGLFQAADAALYRAKREGRNQVRAFSAEGKQ